MKLICSMIADFVHISVILLICKDYLLMEKRRYDKWKYIIVIVISCLASIILYCEWDESIELLIYLASIISILYVCFSEKFIKIFVSGIWVSLVVEIIEAIFSTIFKVVGKGYYIDNRFVNIIVACLTFAFLVFVGFGLKRVYPLCLKKVSLKYVFLYTVILVLDYAILSLLLDVTKDETVHRNTILYSIVFIAVSVGILIQMMAVLLLVVSRNAYREKEAIIAQQLDNQVKYYEYLKDKEKETKKFRHDIRNHLYSLNELRRSGKKEEFEEYFLGIIDCVENIGSEYNVGNDIVNALINKAGAEAREKGIEMKVIGHFPSECYISAYDLCTIFSNLLDNAIEGAQNAEKKKIWIEAAHLDEEIFVKIGNTYANELKVKNNVFHTSKEKKDYHGWGLENVKDSLKNTNGFMDIYATNDEFVVIVKIDVKGLKYENSNC